MWERPDHFGQSIPGQGALEKIKKKAEQASGTSQKAHFSPTSASFPMPLSGVFALTSFNAII